MIEVESKIKVENPSEMRKRIKSLSGVSYEGKQKKVDDYYTLEPLSKYPKKSLRVRKKSGHYEVNFKKKISYEEGVHAKNEEEFKVSDMQHFLNLIDDFGFRRWLRKEKVTELYRIKKNFSIELNKVKHLGWYVEIEYLAEKSEIKKARREVKRIMEKLSIKDKDVVKSGYTKELWNKGKLGV